MKALQNNDKNTDRPLCNPSFKKKFTRPFGLWIYNNFNERLYNDKNVWPILFRYLTLLIGDDEYNFCIFFFVISF